MSAAPRSAVFETPQEAAAAGMLVAFTARSAPDRPAILSARGDRTYADLNKRANQLAQALRSRGLAEGDAVALLCSNRPEFVEVYAACLRAGFRMTCLNWHLQADEAGYIVDDCEARAFIAEGDRVAEVAAEAAKAAPKATVRLAIGDAIPGFDSYDAALEEESPSDLADPVRGGTMLYTSGTTGRPKGVHRRTPPPADRTPGHEPMVRGESVVLCTGPLYHAAPLQTNLIVPLARGVTVVLMDRWTPEETLALIEQHRVSHTHMVATMFHRLLALPEETRNRHNLSSLRYVLHGAAPTPVHVKQAMMDWLGPKLFEYYAATEGGGTFITATQWLEKPGSVGPPNPGRVVEILDDDGRPLPTGEVGTVYFNRPDQGAFEYFKDVAKTASAYRGDRFTLGDHGYLDEDGYLFLTGRTSETIISAGVNIYPAEVDAVLLMHPAVGDAATVGVPNDERGEEVKAVVQPAPGHEPSEDLAAELIAFCRDRLAHFKCPRSVDFDPALPRGEAGKIQRHKVRERYWEGRDQKF
jgi:long-chain acyl-CoA synthetase